MVTMKRFQDVLRANGIAYDVISPSVGLRSVLPDASWVLRVQTPPDVGMIVNYVFNSSGSLCNTVCVVERSGKRWGVLIPESRVFEIIG